MARPRLYYTFQDQATSDSDGNELLVERFLSPFDIVDDCDVITIEISGTAVSGTTHFELKVTPDGDYYPIAGIRPNDYFISAVSTGINEVWWFDIGAFYSFRCRVSDVSGGNITIKGKISKYI